MDSTFCKFTCELNLKNKVDNIYKSIATLRNDLKDLLDTIPEKFIDLQDKNLDSIYGFVMCEDSAEEFKILAIRVNNECVEVYIDITGAYRYCLPLTKEELQNDSKGWYPLGEFSDLLNGFTTLNVCENIESIIQYINK